MTFFPAFVVALFALMASSTAYRFVGIDPAIITLQRSLRVVRHSRWSKSTFYTCPDLQLRVISSDRSDETGDCESAADEVEKTRIAMLNARKNSATKTSPGANLSTAEEQAEAAFADIINTSMEQQ